MHYAHRSQSTDSIAFYTFDFTCGSFTTGHGHYQGGHYFPEQNITQALEKAGERNCNIVFKNRVEASSLFDRPPAESKVSFQVTGRWHTALFGQLAQVAGPFIVPMIVSKLGGASNESANTKK